MIIRAVGLPAGTARPSWLLTAAILALSMLTACASISHQELEKLGSQITPASVDFAEITDYAYRARAAYRSEAEIRQAYPKTIRVGQPGSTGVQYFLEQDDAKKLQTLSIRGTASKTNLREDMKTHLRDDKKIDIPVHTGFDQDAQAIYADVKPYLKKGYVTRVAGHSLGGAVGSLVAIYAIEDGHDVQKVVTFGQPRFTTSKGVPKIGFLPLLRVVDENDIIPMIPVGTPNKVHGPYEQIGPEVILLEGPNYVYLPAHDAARLSVGELWREVGTADLPDHKMDNYLRRLSSKTKTAVQVSYNQREKYTKRPPSKTATIQ